jgi:hypothetical protein
LGNIHSAAPYPSRPPAVVCRHRSRTALRTVSVPGVPCVPSVPSVPEVPEKFLAPSARPFPPVRQPGHGEAYRSLADRLYIGGAIKKHCFLEITSNGEKALDHIRNSKEKKGKENIGRHALIWKVIIALIGAIASAFFAKLVDIIMITVT